MAHRLEKGKDDLIKEKIRYMLDEIQDVRDLKLIHAIVSRIYEPIGIDYTLLTELSINN